MLAIGRCPASTVPNHQGNLSSPTRSRRRPTTSLFTRGHRDDQCGIGSCLGFDRPEPARGLCRQLRDQARSCLRPRLPAKVSPAPQAPAKVMPARPGSEQDRSGAPGSEQDHAGTPGPEQDRSGALGSGQDRAGAPGSGQDRAGAPGSGQVRAVLLPPKRRPSMSRRLYPKLRTRPWASIDRLNDSLAGFAANRSLRLA